MKKKFMLVLLVLSVALFGLQARDSFGTVGGMFSSMSQKMDIDGFGSIKGTVSLIGAEVSAYSFENEFVSNGMFVQGAFLFPNKLTISSGGSSISIKTSDIYDSAFLLNLLAGYAHRRAVTSEADMLLGVGANLKFESIKVGSDSNTSTTLGVGANIAFRYMVNPQIAIHGGVEADVGLLKLSGESSGPDITTSSVPYSISPFLALGFSF